MTIATQDIQTIQNMSAVGVCLLDEKGLITYANQYELENLGFRKGEYVGHHISEFHLEEMVFNDMMTRLEEGETLRNYPAKVQGKYGIVYLLLDCSKQFEAGKFSHIRFCTFSVGKEAFEVLRRHSTYRLTD